jgi:photosynthetic reaction center H subunit
MKAGALGNYIDIAQVALYLFWIFFAGLIYYLHRENKREGYPLEHDNDSRKIVQGWPAVPAPKVFRLRDGTTRSSPPVASIEPPLNASAGFNSRSLGTPLDPHGDPMLAHAGPGAYAMRADLPDMTFDGHPKLVPLRVATDYRLEAADPDPRGMQVFGADGKAGAVVKDLWVDRAETILRYLELEIKTTAGADRIMLPMTFARISNGKVTVNAIHGHQFVNVPRIKSAESITLLEEEKVMAYYGGGTLYADPSRMEPLV